MRTRPAIAIAALCASAALLAGCSGASTLDNTKLTDGISSGLTEQLGGEWTVTCPEDQPLEQGYTFTCDVENAEGTSGQIKVTEDDAEGNVSWETITE